HFTHVSYFSFFFLHSLTTSSYPLSLHDALPISFGCGQLAVHEPWACAQVAGGSSPGFRRNSADLDILTGGMDRLGCVYDPVRLVSRLSARAFFASAHRRRCDSGAIVFAISQPYFRAPP